MIRKIIGVLAPLRQAFTRESSYIWFVTFVVGLVQVSENRGVAGIVRALGFNGKAYHSLVRACASCSFNLRLAYSLWVANLLTLLKPFLVSINGRVILLADGLKVPKEGRRMPAVRLLHQESDSNSKPNYIMGHMFQAVSILISGAGRDYACPLAIRVHSGLRMSPHPEKTLVTKLVELVLALPILQNYYLIADSYYCAHKAAIALTKAGNHLISRVKRNGVAYHIPIKKEHKTRGAPRKRGDKVYLNSLFEGETKTIMVTIYGKELEASCWCKDLIWRDYGTVVRYVGVLLKDGKKAIFMSTDVDLSPKQIIEAYGYRFKIEVGFRAFIHTVMGTSYHFWSKTMDKIKRRSKDQFLHRKSKESRTKILKKLECIERFVFCAVVAQGLLQYLAVAHTFHVWGCFRGWFRTLNTSVSPTEEVVKSAVRTSYTRFIIEESPIDKIEENIFRNIDTNQLFGKNESKMRDTG